VMRAALESRLAALEGRLIEPTEPRKSLLPNWLMEELEARVSKLEQAGSAENSNSREKAIGKR
jgi:BMFP domain-containing protein YqiC